MRSEALSRRRFIVGDELSDFGRSITDVIALVEGVPRDIVDDIPVSEIARKAADEMVILPPSTNINACELFGEAFVEAEAQVYEGIVDYLRDGIVGADMLVRICHTVDSSDSLDKEASWRGGARGGGVLAVNTSIFGELSTRDAPCDIVVS